MINVKRVYEENGNFYALSDESPFYPDGKGGQLGDRGKIGSAKVFKVEERGTEIVHLLDRPIEPGEYEYSVDESRRLDIAIQHTAQHILSAAFLKTIQARTISFHMGEEFSTIDLDLPQLTIEALEESESLANKVVRSCIEVQIIHTDRETAEKMDLRKSLSDKIGELVRVVKIGDFDLSACGGFHVKNTGEIGIVKVVAWEKAKGTLTRVYFLAGNRALSDYAKRVLVLRELSKLLTSSVDEMKERVFGLLEKIKDQASLINRLAEELAKNICNTLPTQQMGRYRISFYEGFDEVANALAKYFTTDLLICKTSEGYQFASKDFDCSKLISKLKESLSCSGGGGVKRGMLKSNVSWNELLLLLQKELEVM
ncbi:alanyl-tRNA editing protein [Pseudothermotoga sp. U03pept]|uniref:alanyl-tRNA editing protein n=1 Tax=Pseudothermotoga sp. U03pept TaxID=3447012 RepID=UPI003F1234BE